MTFQRHPPFPASGRGRGLGRLTARLHGPRDGNNWAGAVLLVGLPLPLWCAAPLTVAAHPLDNFTVNHYSRIAVSPERMQVMYVLDIAEIPTFQELSALPTDITKDNASRTRYAAMLAERIRQQVRLTLDSTPVTLTTDALELSFPPGQADLPTLRLSARYVAVTTPPERERRRIPQR